MENSWVVVGGGRIEQKGKRTHGLGQQCGNCLGGGGIKILNGNGKKPQDFIHIHTHTEYFLRGKLAA